MVQLRRSSGLHGAEDELAPVEERVLLGHRPGAQALERPVAAVLHRDRPLDRVARAEVAPGRRGDGHRRPGRAGDLPVRPVDAELGEALPDPRLLLVVALGDERLRAVEHAPAVRVRGALQELAAEADLVVLDELVGIGLRLLVLLLLRRQLHAGVGRGGVLLALALQRLRDLVLLLVEEVAELERRLLDAALLLPRLGLLRPGAGGAAGGVREVGVEVGLAHRARRREVVHLLLQRAAGQEQHVRGDPDLLDRDVAGREVLRDRQLERGLLVRPAGLGEVVEHLDGALPEASAAR